MSSNGTAEATRIFPVLRYRDAPAMIDWLQRAFGFRKHAVHENPDRSIAHAQLACGSGMVMLSSAKDDDFARLVGPPAPDGRTTQTIYIAVANVDAHHDTARAAGAQIVMPLTDTDYGSRDYICRDPEGQVWCFGTYWPKADDAPAAG